jgi:hypothetical protein
MRIIALFLILSIQICNLFSQSLIVIANPNKHNGYLTKKVQIFGLGCEVAENELCNENSDFGLEIQRMLPTWKKFFPTIKVVFWHNNKQTVSFEDLKAVIQDYEYALFLDHYDKNVMFGLDIQSFSQLINASNTALLGVCYGCELTQRMTLSVKNSYCAQAKYYGGKIGAKNPISALGF